MKINKKKILIVDDDQEYLQLMLNCLFEGGYLNILCATGGQDAIEIAHRELPDLILQDWDMPGMSGIDVIRALGRSKFTRDIPVIITTGAMLENTDLDFGLAAGAKDYIRKPIDKIELLARIRSALEYAELLQTIEQQNNELEEQKESIEKNRKRLQTMVDASEEALVFVKDGFITDVSDRYLAFSGYRYEDIIGKPFLSIAIKEERTTVLALEKEEITVARISLLTMDGEYLPCFVRLNPFSFNGDTMQVLSIQNLMDSPMADSMEYRAAGKEGAANDPKLAAEVRALKSKVENLNRQLGSVTLREFQINEFVVWISGKLNSLKGSRDLTNSRTRKVLLEIIQEISLIQNDKLWEEFRIRFDEIHPDFYRRILHDYPSLTETDLRTIAFIKLNLSTKEIADITVQPVNTIKAIRKRIRQKLGLTDTAHSLLSVIGKY